MRPRILDLFAGAGGAAMGYHRAGFDVVGVDRIPQPNYPFPFVQADALNPPFDLSAFDAIHASPPCQRFTALNRMWNSKQHLDLLTPTLEWLRSQSVPWVVENVERAPMSAPIRLCGSMFGLGTADAELRRHRLFESSLAMLTPPCVHGQKERVIGVYGGHGRDRRRTPAAPDFTLEERRQAMGINWMNGQELSEAIPPAYTQWIGKRLIEHFRLFPDIDYEVPRDVGDPEHPRCRTVPDVVEHLTREER